MNSAISITTLNISGLNTNQNAEAVRLTNKSKISLYTTYRGHTRFKDIDRLKGRGEKRHNIKIVTIERWSSY
jgi:hypothetical protein